MRTRRSCSDSSRSTLPGRIRASGLPGLGVLTVLVTAFSEAFYWYAGGTDFPTRVLFYLIPTTALLWTLSAFAVSGWQGVIIAGAIYGFITEGVLTPIMYGAFPFDPFSMSYTSLAWHALLTVGFGVVMLHRMLVRGRLLPALAGVAAFGAFWGVWATTLPLPDGANEETEGIALFTGHVSVGLFMAYTVAVSVVVALCHALLGRTITASDLTPNRLLGKIMLAAGVLYFAVMISWAVPWSGPVLALMLWLCRKALLTRQATSTADPRVLDVITEPVPWPRLLVLVALPITSVVVFAGLDAASLSESVIRDFCLNLVVGVQTVAGWVVFIAALVSTHRSFSDPSQTSHSAGRRLARRCRARLQQ